MTLDRMADADPNQDRIEVPGSPPTPRHLVRPHSRKLPPAKKPPPDPAHLTLDFEVPVVEPPPRFTSVKPHVRRNPRRKENPMSMTPPLVSSDPVDLARLNDPQTSHDAAESALASGSISRSQAWVLEMFRKVGQGHEATGVLPGMIDHDLEAIARETQVRLTPQRIRTARHDLYQGMLLEKAGRKRKTPYGRDAEVYVLTERGRTIDFTPYHDDRTDGR